MAEYQVHEMQGLYGPFTLTERILQKIWLRQDFQNQDLETYAGKPLIILEPGKWNSQEGPDFKDARMLIDGETVQGDVEVHFNVNDWNAHQHSSNPNFNRVVLHVVLHRPEQNNSQVETSNNKCPELLTLLPLLNRDLEAYATDEALLELEQQDTVEWVMNFIRLPLEKRIKKVWEKAEERWLQKLKYAKQRLTAMGYEGACHQFAMEVLGYTRNRAPMGRLATVYPLDAMRQGRFTAEDLFEEEAGNWKLNGLRPANHPKLRLEQYLRLVAQIPDWPDQFATYLKTRPVVASPGMGTGVFRREAGIGQKRQELEKELFASAIRGGRLNTLLCDALFPLATAAGICDCRDYWMHWPIGNMPTGLGLFLKQAELTNRSQPNCNGLSQGALAMFYA